MLIIPAIYTSSTRNYKSYYAKATIVLQFTARASKYCMIRSSPCNASKQCIVTRFYDSIYVGLPCEPGRKAVCLRECDYEAGHTIPNVQTHMQSTVHKYVRTYVCILHKISYNYYITQKRNCNMTGLHYITFLYCNLPYVT